MKVVMAVVLLVLFCFAQGCAYSGGRNDESYLLNPMRLPAYCAPTREPVCVIHCVGVTHTIYNLSVLEGHDTYDVRSLCRSLRRRR